LIGRTPLGLFDPDNDEKPTLIEPGDRVVFRSITARDPGHMQGAG
jgi:allophanate hydrolase subunit 1